METINADKEKKPQPPPTAYVLGLFICKTVSYLQGVAVSASINTMVIVTMDK